MSNNASWGSKYSWGAAFTVASVWFGTHVGGGFASGNQIIQYYSQYGITAVIYPLLAMSLLAVVMYIIMKFAKLNGYDNYKDTFSALYPTPKMEFLFEIFYVVILLAAMASAVAGAGNVFANFLGIEYVGTAKVLCNLLIVVVLIILSIFGIKLVIAASTVLSAAILVVTAIMVIVGLSADFSSISASYLSQNALTAAAYTNDPFSAAFRGIFIYAAFQCVSVAPMIAAATELNQKGLKRTAILGGIMNGGALALCALMLWKWYPLLAALQSAGVEGFTKCLNIPNQTVLTLTGIKWVLVIFSVLLFCAFVSTCVTLLYSMVQRFQGHCFPKAIKSEKFRGIIVAAITIAVCFAISLLGLTSIVKYAYGYCGYYSLVIIVLPAFIWGIPKCKKLSAQSASAGK